MVKMTEKHQFCIKTLFSQFFEIGGFKISKHDISMSSNPIDLKFLPVILEYITLGFSEADFLFLNIFLRYKGSKNTESESESKKNEKSI